MRRARGKTIRPPQTPPTTITTSPCLMHDIICLSTQRSLCLCLALRPASVSLERAPSPF